MKTIFFLICIGLGFISFSQKKTAEPPQATNKPAKTNYTRFSLEKRLSFYPFSQSSQIQIVSFGPQMEICSGDLIKVYKLPRLHDTICFSKLDQVKRLSLSEIRKLSDILYNTCPRLSVSVEESSGCWYPRNAIIFFDTSAKAFEYIEICFECGDYEKSNAAIPDPLDCTYAFNDLQDFFEKAGIQTSEGKKNDD